MDTDADPDGVDKDALDELARLDAAIGRRLRQIRRHQEMSVEQLAKASGIGARTLARFEKGERGMSVRQLGQISRVLGVKPGAIIDEVEAEINSAATQEDTDSSARKEDGID